jgi:hypothetical protein
LTGLPLLIRAQNRKDADILKLQAKPHYAAIRIAFSLSGISLDTRVKGIIGKTCILTCRGDAFVLRTWEYSGVALQEKNQTACARER